MCKHRVRFVQYVGEGNGKASSRKHWNSYDVRIRSTSRAVFFLKLGCLSGCFDRILLLSASSGYHTLSEGTLRIPAKIFDLRQPAQIHIHIQIVPRWYIHVPALPGLQKEFYESLTDAVHGIRTPADKMQYTVKHWKDCLL